MSQAIQKEDPMKEEPAPRQVIEMVEEEEEVFTYNPNGNKKGAVAVRSGKPTKKANQKETNKAIYDLTDMVDNNDIDLEEIPTTNNNQAFTE